MKFLTILNFMIFFTLSMATAEVVVPDDYEVLDGDKVSYVYAKEYEKVLPAIKLYQQEVIDGYEEEFGIALDDKLRVGLASSNNQISNAFSSQLPLNMQVLYGAGAVDIDYFCSSSWIHSLLLHETTHNFQLNPKENFLSRAGHKLLGNNPIAFLGFFPIFPIPNLTESSFILEGNAVMNESRFGNGGRLFSGYALAEVVALAKAGEITPQLMYNSTLNFPYSERFYLVGGFFQKFLVERYGIKKVNGYFKRYATQAFPFFTNSVFKEQFGETFEVLLSQFAKEMRQKHKEAKTLKGKRIAKSQIFVPLNSDKNEIYTLISDRKSAPKLLQIDRKTALITKTKDDYIIGKVFKVGGAYYTQTSAKISPTKVKIGLFDHNGLLKKDTEGKAIQGYMANKKEVYFDIKSSLERPQVYVDGKFYTQSSSSVHVDKNDLYYFKQEGEKRTLFKNRTALYSFIGHYGFVSDIDSKGAIYFIASSKHGSTVYQFDNGAVKRVNEADNIIDFKLLSDKKALVVTIEANGYAYSIISLGSSVNSSVYVRKVPAVKKSPALYSELSTKKPKSKAYNPLTQLEYSSLSPIFSYDSYYGVGVNAIASFVDPLFQNQLSLQGSHNNERDIVATRYDNTAFRLNFGGDYYQVFKNKNYDNSNKRDNGYDLYATFPWLEEGYWSISSTLAYTRAYNNIYRTPLTLSFDMLNKKQYGLSKYANELNALSLFISEDRDNKMYGATYNYKHDLPWQSYFGIGGSYLKSDTMDFGNEKGIELDNTFTFSYLQSDLATLNVPSFNIKTYAQEVKMAELSLAKVFDGSLYFYSFPLSLQREALYAKQRRYEIEFTNTVSRSYNETTVGAEFDLLFIHKLEIPLSLEWIYNKDIRDSNQVRLLFGVSF